MVTSIVLSALMVGGGFISLGVYYLWKGRNTMTTVGEIEERAEKYS